MIGGSEGEDGEEDEEIQVRDHEGVRAVAGKRCRRMIDPNETEELVHRDTLGQVIGVDR